MLAWERTKDLAGGQDPFLWICLTSPSLPDSVGGMFGQQPSESQQAPESNCVELRISTCDHRASGGSRGLKKKAGVSAPIPDLSF